MKRAIGLVFLAWAMCLIGLASAGLAGGCKTPSSPIAPLDPVTIAYDELVEGGCVLPAAGFVDALAAQEATGQPPWLVCMVVEGGTVAGCNAPCYPDAAADFRNGLIPAAARPVDSGVVHMTGDAATGGSATLVVTNSHASPAMVFVSFGADSIVTASSWSFCHQDAGLNCTFQLAANTSMLMPLGGLYVNATFSFYKPVTCNTTKAEVNLNNPNWYDITDVSLVDGYSEKIAVFVSPPGVDGGSVSIGPPLGREGNEKVFGVYPFGCDICVARKGPPCGLAPGRSGCKSGTQYAPDVPCQYQGSILGGAGLYDVTFEK